jgi:hypothetical protein
MIEAKDILRSIGKREGAISPIIDPIPAWTGWLRKMTTFRYVSAAEFRQPMSQQEFVDKMSAIQCRAVGTPDMMVKTTGFWAMENLGATFVRHARSGHTFNDPHLPVEVRPIAHCGMGVGAVEVSDFEPGKLVSLIESMSNPEYKMFGYENVGSMLGVYEPDLFTTMAKGFSLLGLLPIAPLHWPEPDVYLRAFEPEVRRLISHGYGRMVYFKGHSIASAIRTAAQSKGFDFGACVQGIAFAYSMANNSDLHRVWRAGEIMDGLAEGRFFNDGLIFAMEFWEWMSPGTLDTFAPRTAHAAALIAAARQGVAMGRRSGALPAFAVDPQAGRPGAR